MGTIWKIAEVVGMGKFDDNSHPIHPATVHFPLTFLSLSYALDSLYGLATSTSTADAVSRVYDVAPYLGDISRASYISNNLGIITALPAAATGVAELVAMIKSNGLWERIERQSDKKVVYEGMNPKVRHGIAHALLNEVALVVSLYNWWTRRDKPGYVPSGTNVLLSMLTLPGVMFSAYLGGAMVYKYGVGVMRQGEAKRIKEDAQRDELKRFDEKSKTQFKERKDQ